LGWSKNLIEDERIKEKFFEAEIEEIKRLEGKIAELEGELNDLLEGIEDWDEEEQGDKTANKVKEYLGEVTKDLKASQSESAAKEAAKWQRLTLEIEDKERELKKLRKKLKDKEQGLEEKTKRKRESLSEEEVKELLLDKFYNLINEQLTRYLNTEKKEIIKIFENLWDKYKVSLLELNEERNREVKKLNEFLENLGYYRELGIEEQESGAYYEGR
jgi:type I restriction enzyme M protein